jgi:hypothetical protein
MRRAQQALLKAKTDLSEIETLSDQIVQRNDPAEFARTRERLKAIEAAFAACREKLNNLDKYVMEGLARPELTPKELPELGELRDDAAKAAMSVGQIRQVRAKVRE